MKYLILLLVFPLFAQNPVNLVRSIPTAPNAVMHVDSLSLSGITTGTANMTLAAAPISGMGAIVIFNSSQLGASAVVPVTSIQNTLVFTLPSYIFTPTDIINVVYWSTK